MSLRLKFQNAPETLPSARARQRRHTLKSLESAITLVDVSAKIHA